MSDKPKTKKTAASTRHSPAPAGSTFARAAEIIEEYADLLRESSQRPDLKWDDREAESDYTEMVEVAKALRAATIFRSSSFASQMRDLDKNVQDLAKKISSNKEARNPG